MATEIILKNGDALMIVDLQNDFCPGGALPIEDGDKVLPIVNAWVQEAVGEGVPIYASRDWHPNEHISFKAEGGKWPPHCIQDSSGAAFHRNLLLPEKAVVVTKGVRFDKDQNSAFDETGLEVKLEHDGIRRLFICGLALDVCVLATALDARRLGFEVVLILDASRPVTQAAGDAAVQQMKKAGALVVGQSAGSAHEESNTRTKTGSENAGELPVCTKAPEWAEHERLTDSDEPCDDGRAGKS